MVEMREIEVKILEIDAKAVGNRIRELGGRRVSHGEMHAIFYDFDDGRVARTRDLPSTTPSPNGCLAYST